MTILALILAVAALAISSVAFYRMAGYASPPVKHMTFMFFFVIFTAFFAGSLAERVLP